MRVEKKQYFDRNIWDMSIDITYFVRNILQVGISRSTYYISFERMRLTGKYHCHLDWTIELYAIYVFRVASHSEQNQMNASNLGIVFGPTLLRPQ